MKPLLLNQLRRPGSLAGLVLTVAAACAPPPTGTARSGKEESAGVSPAAALGEKLFHDTALSASGQQSCATCHVQSFAFSEDSSAAGPDRGLPVALGGPQMNLAGFRNTPSLMYVSFSPDFSFDSQGNPSGGFFRDGRAPTLAEQAAAPFLNPVEIANPDAAAVIERLKKRPYFGDFVALYGSDVLGDPVSALYRAGQAIAAYETEDSDFHPFTSKYDYWLKGQAQLSPQEERGLALFNDPSKGNCAACHPSRSTDGATPPLFTDFSYDNLGVPRNDLIPSDSSSPPSYTPTDSGDGLHGYYDLGICGPFRPSDDRNLSGICGQFKVPTLRNIALSAPYFHNGRFPTLQVAIGFYVRRDTNPEEWYPTAPDGTVTKYDDLPAIYGGQFKVKAHVPGSDAGYVGNVNTLEVPYNRRIGDAPALDVGEISDLVAFLCALTDGFDPQRDGAQVLPAQCPTAINP